MSVESARNVTANVSSRVRKVLMSDKVKFVLKNKKTIISLIYMLSPIDLIPDAVPVVGVIDDVIPIIWAMCDMVDRTFNTGNEAVDMPEEIKNNTNTSSKTYTNISKVTDAVSSVKSKMKYNTGDVIDVPECDVRVKDVVLKDIISNELKKPDISLDFDDRLT